MNAVPKILFRAALPLFLTFASVNAQQTLPQAPRMRSEPVVLTVTVTTEMGQFVGGLQQSNFEVLENKVVQAISSFSDLDEPASIGILLDTSTSMAGMSAKRNMQGLTNALAAFLQLSNPANEYFVVGFSTEPWLPMDWTSDRGAVLQKFASLMPKGQTALYDACYSGIQKVLEGRYHKRIIILISDGQDNYSRHKFKDVRELLKQSNVLLYSVGFSGDDYSHGPEGDRVLDELSLISGGKAFFPRPGSKMRETYDVLEWIGQELHSHYTLSFTPSPSTGKKMWHKIKIKVSPSANATREEKRLYARSREGYYQY